MRNHVVVVGGGAAGMLAAIAASRAGAQVTLLERNEKLGKKIYITGKGRCNVTNDCSQEDFLSEVPRNPRFLYSALSCLSPQDMMALLEDGGCPVEVQRGRRVFPQTEKASDVNKTLTRLLEKAGVKVRLGCRVAHLELGENNHIAGVTLQSGETIQAGHVILGCGGLSYPSTGSTGDGYRLAKEAGHSVTVLTPSLTAMETKDDWPKTLQGLSLKNVSLSAFLGKKKVYSELGEMLFTHFGISGPLVLEMSSHLTKPSPDYKVELDMKPGLTMEQLTSRLEREVKDAPRKQLQNILPGLLPQKMCGIFPSLAKVAGDKQCAQLSRQDIRSIVETLKCLPVPLSKPRPLEEAIVTRGGVHVKEINAATMESKCLPGLYLAGEMIDVDAHTGGYNLQIAFSTGYLAGRSAAQA